MDTSVLIFVLIGLIVVAVLLVFRQQIRIGLRWLGMGLDIEGSNKSASQGPGIDARGITSRKGGDMAQDTTGRGVKVNKVKAQDDVLLSSAPPPAAPDPKDQPPI